MEIYYGLRSKESSEVIGVVNEYMVWREDLGWDFGDGYKLCPLLSTEGALLFLLSTKWAMQKVLDDNPSIVHSHYETPNHGLIDVDKLEIYEIDINPDKSQYQLRKRGEPKSKENKNGTRRN